MENTIKVFVGCGDLCKLLCGYISFNRFEYARVDGDPHLSESDYILYRLGRRYEGGFIDEVSVGCDNGEYEPVLFDDWIARVDEAIDVKSYFEELLLLGTDIFYFAELESSVERIRFTGLPVEVYIKDDRM